MTIRTITIPLQTEPWQRDLLQRRMELCRSLYNAELKEVERRYHAMQHDGAYAACKAIIDDAYAQPTAAARSAAKATPAYQKAVDQQTALHRT